MQQTNANELLQFLDESPSMFHVVENVRKKLIDQGYIPLCEKDQWQLKNHGRYFVEKNNAAIVAFQIENVAVEQYGFRLAAAHTDSPTFKVKPVPEMSAENHYIKLNTECYGGPILSTWLDRPLSLAGKVVVKGDHPLHPKTKLVSFSQPLLTIPNLAIHLNREMNEGYAYNKQRDLLPLLTLLNEQWMMENTLVNAICAELEIAHSDLLDFDLFLYDVAKGTTLGLNQEFFSAGKLDDLWMVHASLSGFLEAKPSRGINVVCYLAHEEVGSASAVGAESRFLADVLKRICLALHKTEEDFLRALNNSILVSADLAHGVHPNTPEKHDPTNRPVLGKGPVLKYSANQRYSTDAESAAVFIGICQECGIPYQQFVNRSDLTGGTTMGPTFATQLGMPVIDMGAAILSMHSVRELGAVKDIEYMQQFFQQYFSL